MYFEEGVDQWSGAVLYGSDTAVSEISDWKRKRLFMIVKTRTFLRFI